MQFHQLLTVRLFSTAVFLQERAECGRRRRRSRDLQPQCRGRESHSLRKKRKRLFKKQICRAEKSFARRAHSGSGMCISARGVRGAQKTEVLNSEDGSNRNTILGTSGTQRKGKQRTREVSREQGVTRSQGWNTGEDAEGDVSEPRGGRQDPAPGQNAGRGGEGGLWRAGPAARAACHHADLRAWARRPGAPPAFQTAAERPNLVFTKLQTTKGNVRFL